MKVQKEFLLLLAPYKKKVFLALIAVLMANVLGLVFPWTIKLVIDEVLVKKNVFLLNLVAGVLIVVFALKFYFGFLREYLCSLIGERVVCDLRNKLYWHLQRLSVGYVENTPTGRIISSIITDVESIKTFLFGGMIDFIYSFVNVLFVLAVLLVIDWRLTLVALVFFPFVGLTYLKLSPRLEEKYGSVREQYAELTARLNEVFNGIRIVAGFAKEEYESDTFNLKQKEMLESSMGTHTLGIVLWMSAEFFSSLGLVAIIWFGARRVFSGQMSAGTLMAFYSYVGILFFPVIKMAVINSYYQEASVSLRRIHEVLARQPQIRDREHPIRLDKLKGNVRFSQVSFSYGDQREVLSHIDLQVNEREVVALVGKSGAGKTTLINLLLRFYEPSKGTIFIDGYSLTDLELKSYRSRIAMVIQDDYLFSATIKENILYSKPGASDNEVIKAAGLANAHQFIMELPRGYDTQIGERGVKLSYGQRQRISIARAMLRDPAILILDEATSSVDSETERLIIEEAFNNLMHGRTTFIIAHRLSTISCAERIVFIEDGRITETGKHYQLLEKKGGYWKMFREQNRENLLFA